VLDAQHWVGCVLGRLVERQGDAVKFSDDVVIDEELAVVTHRQRVLDLQPVRWE